MEIDKDALLKDMKIYDPIGNIFQFYTSSQKDAEYGEKAKEIYKVLKWVGPTTFDVINSFWTTFSFCMHSMFPNLYSIAEAGNVKIYKTHNTKYNIDSFPEKYFKENSNEKRKVECICEEFCDINKLATFCHSIANFMPCPNGFNQTKGGLSDVRDYFPLMIDKIQKCVDENKGLDYTLKNGDRVNVDIDTIKVWHKWFANNIEIYCLTMYYEIDEQNKLIGNKFFARQSLQYPCPKEKEEIKECLRNIVQCIEDRSVQIFEKHSNYLSK